MNLRAYPAVTLFLALLASASVELATAQDVDVGKIVSDAMKEKAPAPAPTPAAEPANATKATAEAIRGDLADIADATELWAKEKKKSPKTKVTLKEIQPYLKPDSQVPTSGGNDRAGNPYDFGTVESGPHVATATAKALGQPDSFWGDFAPLVSKKEMAATTLADLKQIRLAILTWEADHPEEKGLLTFDVLKGYLPPESDLWKMGGNDRLGNTFVLGTTKDPVHISPESYKTLGMPKDYWGEFAPKSGSTRTVRRDDDDDYRVRSHRGFGRKVKDFFKGF